MAWPLNSLYKERWATVFLIYRMTIIVNKPFFRSKLFLFLYKKRPALYLVTFMVKEYKLVSAIYHTNIYPASLNASAHKNASVAIAWYLLHLY